LRYLRVGGRRQNFESRILFGCRKMLENAAESHPSSARFVGQLFAYHDL